MIKIINEIWSSLDTKEKSYLKLGLNLILITGFISIVILPWLLTREKLSIIDYKETGPIGDTINGIAGPFIAMLAAILTFLAFYIQYKANMQQREQFTKSLEKQNEERKGQEQIWRIERFENKFYELLKLHKANVNEMNIDNKVFGRKCFLCMFYELRCCYKIVQDFYERENSDTKMEYEFEKINIIDFSYRIFFFGIGLHSEKHFIHNFKKGETFLFEKMKPFFKNIQNLTVDYLKNKSNEGFYPYGITNNGISNAYTTEFYYSPFNGHADRLGHYYRHLFQTMTYITAPLFIDDNEKYSYVKTLRVQVSNFEQLMIYYNALAWFDEEWRMFFTKYRFIKNLPLTLADFNEAPEKHFATEIAELRKKGIEMFEWLE